jgi:hypothetical protein
MGISAWVVYLIFCVLLMERDELTATAVLLIAVSGVLVARLDNVYGLRRRIGRRTAVVGYVVLLFIGVYGQLHIDRKGGPFVVGIVFCLFFTLARWRMSTPGGEQSGTPKS